MKQTVYPLHAPLSSRCAQEILDRHAKDLPDLTGIVILAPNGPSCRTLRSDLLREAVKRGTPGLLLPPILPLAVWVHQNHDFNGVENHLSELLDLVAAMRDAKFLPTLSRTDSWHVASELMGLFEKLWLNETALPEDHQELVVRLQDAYGIEEEPPEPLGMEANIVHLLWKAWDQGSGHSLSAGKYYREALLRLRPAANAQAVYLCGYDQLSAVEVRALRQLSESVPVSLFTRPYFLGSLDSPEPSESKPPSPYAAVLQQTFAIDQAPMPQRAQNCRKQYPQDPLQGRLHTFVAEQAEIHARSIDIQIRRWLKQGHERIGLVSADHKLTRRVNALLKRANIHVRDYSGWALSTSSAASVILRWLECLEQDFYYLGFLDVLKSPFASLYDSADSPDIAEFEQKIYRYNVHSGLENYRQVVDGDPQWIAMLDAAANAAKPMQNLPAQPTGRAYLDALQKSLQKIRCWDLLASDEVGGQILSQIERMRFQLGRNETQLPKAQWLTLLRQTLEQTDYQLRPPQEKVVLISLKQAHLARFDCLIIAGMEAQSYPGKESSYLVFNDAVRGELGLPTGTEFRNQSLQRFLSLILSPKQILLTYQKIDPEGKPMLPSVWWNQIDVFHRLAYGRSLDAPGLAALSLHPDAQVRPPAFEFREHPTGVMPKPVSQPEMLPNRLSASSHQALIDCPYRFYVRYMLGIRELDEMREEMDHAEFGQYVHECLEAFHAGIDGVPGPWPGPIAGKEEEATRLLWEIGECLMQRRIPNFSNIAFQERYHQIAERYVRSQNIVETNRKILASEQDVEQEIFTGLSLYGRIDRIDEDADGQRIVLDYKTSGTIKIRDYHVTYGEQVQLPTYVLMAGVIAQAEYWWINAGHGSEMRCTVVSGEHLSQTCDKVKARLVGVFRNLRDGYALPANGNFDACRFCYAYGICRKNLEDGSFL